MISDGTLRRILPSDGAVNAVGPLVRIAVGAVVAILRWSG